MAEPPSFLNINDFFGTFLPGYLVVTLYLIFFHYDLLFTKDSAISFDVFSAIVFIVAGPTIGFTLKIFHRQSFNILFILFNGRNRHKENAKNNVKLRLKASDSQKSELDREEAVFDFCMSVPIALLVLSAYYAISNIPHYSNIHSILIIVGFVDSFDIVVHASFLILSAILLLGAIIQYKFTLVPLYRQVFRGV